MRHARRRPGPEARLRARRAEPGVDGRPDARPVRGTDPRSMRRTDPGSVGRTHARPRPGPRLPARVHGRRRTPARDRRRRGPVAPPAPVAVPGAVAVVVGPVAADHEAHDRHADDRAVGGQRHALLLVGVVEVPGPDPAPPAVGQHHVAPAVAAGAADHVDRLPRPEPCHQRVVARGPGAQVDRAAREGLLRRRRERQQQNERAQGSTAQEGCGVHGRLLCAPA
ncbi:hypothetical protein BKP43_64670 [Variovorax boronicumulans]|nr:hypothetical protein BKP43_64670 [Variovorax boronicumulans]